jgi:hypothetical protein
LCGTSGPGIVHLINGLLDARPLVGLAARFTQVDPEKPQVSAPLSALEQLPGHYHPLDLVRALIDLGDRGPAGSFRR